MQIVRRLLMVGLGCGLLVLWLFHGSNRPRPAPPTERPLLPNLPLTASSQDQVKRALAIEAECNQADQSVWAKEMLAEQHEEVFIRLWDDLRLSSNRLQTLAQFPFGELVAPAPSATNPAPHGVNVIGCQGPVISFDARHWEELVHRWQEQGWQLAQSEWRHAGFVVGQDGRAQSTIALTLNLVDSGRGERLVVRGNLDVRWKEAPDAGELPYPERMQARDLTVLTRPGEPLFEHALAKELRNASNLALVDPLLLYDLNGDGLSEIVLPGLNVVYWNRGRGEFQPEPLCSELPNPINAAVIGDFTGDGLPDLLAADRDGLLVFAGDSTGRFKGAGKRVHFTSTELLNPFVITAGDVDGDGLLDVWLAQYKLPYVAGQMPTPYYDANDGFPSFLLLNDGKGGFRDATAEAGLDKKRFRRTYSASFVDLDDDGDLDLVVVSDFAGLDLYLNDGRGHFTEVTDQKVNESHAFGMAHTFGDYDGDGQLDLLVIGMNSYTAQRLDQLGLGPSGFPEHQAMRPKMAYGNRLYLQRHGRWEQTELSDQIARSGWSWGVTSFDFNNDGALDLYIANGHKSRASVKDYETQFWRHDIYLGKSTHDPALDAYFQATADRLYGAGQSYGGYEKNRLYLNESGTAFLEMGFLAGVALEQDCRDVVSDDLDGDGKVDLAVTTEEVWPEARRVLHLFRNRTPDAGNWLGFHLLESSPGYSPIGAKITLTSARGKQMRQIVTGDSFRSQHATTVHFGLGAETQAQVESVEIRWPNGERQKLLHPAINRYYSVAGGARRSDKGTAP